MGVKNSVETKLKERLQTEIASEIEKVKEEILSEIEIAAREHDIKRVTELNKELDEIQNNQIELSLASDIRLDRLKEVISLDYNKDNTSDRFTNTKVLEMNFGPFTVNFNQPELWVKAFKELMVKLYNIDSEKYEELAKNTEYKYLSNSKEELAKICEDKYIDSYNGIYWNNKSNTIYKVKMMYDVIKQYGFNTINFKVVA